MNQPEPDWHKVVNDLAPNLYRYFSGSFRSDLASDLVQETLIRLVKKHRSGEFCPQKGNIKTYAFGIARFIRLETLKDKSSLTLLDIDKLDDLDTAHPTTEKSDKAVHLRWAISRLKPIEQEIVLLMIDSELLLEQIAETLGIPLGTVKSHVHRAKENLRQLMEVAI